MAAVGSRNVKNSGPTAPNAGSAPPGVGGRKSGSTARGNDDKPVKRGAGRPDGGGLRRGGPKKDDDKEDGGDSSPPPRFDGSG